MNLRDSSSNFSQLCGVLAGFCVAFVILFLTPSVFPIGEVVTQDWAVSLVLFSATTYTLSAAIFANAPRLKSAHLRWAYNLGIIFFHLSNLLVLGALSIIIKAFQLLLASQLALGLLILAGIIFIINILALVIPAIRRRVILFFLPPEKRKLYESLRRIFPPE